MRTQMTADFAEVARRAGARLLPVLGLAVALAAASGAPAQASTLILSLSDNAAASLFPGPQGTDSFDLDGLSGTVTLQSGVAQDIALIVLTDHFGRPNGATVSETVRHTLTLTGPGGPGDIDTQGFSQLWQVTDSFTPVMTLSDGGSLLYTLAEGTVAVTLSGLRSGLDYDASLLFTPNAAPSNPGGVPEPTTWALLVSGFGAMGMTLRRRRGMTVPARKVFL